VSPVAGLPPWAARAARAPSAAVLEEYKNGDVSWRSIPMPKCIKQIEDAVQAMHVDSYFDSYVDLYVDLYIACVEKARAGKDKAKGCEP
jgi:hypothetical protein